MRMAVCVRCPCLQQRLDSGRSETVQSLHISKPQCHVHCLHRRLPTLQCHVAQAGRGAMVMRAGMHRALSLAVTSGSNQWLSDRSMTYVCMYVHMIA